MLHFAYDAALTNRQYDKDGRLHILRTRISKATVNPYYGREIPEADTLGLDPNRIYYLLRDQTELKNAAPSFARVPLMFKHIAVSADNPNQDQVAGTIGSDIEFESPYLLADLCVWDAEAIAGIETDTVRELSCSYHYTADMTPGVFEGQPYDGVMRNISGNHVALVESGRAGSDVMAADSNLERNMKETKLGKAIYAILCAISPKLAKDSALKPLVIGLDAKTFDAKALQPKLLAMDEETAKKPETMAAIESAKDAAEHEERKEPAKDEDVCPTCGMKGGEHAEDCAACDEQDNEDVPTAEEREMAKDYSAALDSAFAELEGKFKREGKTDPAGLAYKIGVEKYGKKGMEQKSEAGRGDSKTAKDVEGYTDEEGDFRPIRGSKGYSKSKGGDAKMTQAMDEAINKFKGQLREADEARRAVRPVVGDVIAQDSAAEIYGFALDQMKVDRKGVEGVPALRALFNLAVSASKEKASARPAFDSSSNAEAREKFPNAFREIRVM